MRDRGEKILNPSIRTPEREEKLQRPRRRRKDDNNEWLLRYTYELYWHIFRTGSMARCLGRKNYIFGFRKIGEYLVNVIDSVVPCQLEFKYLCLGSKIIYLYRTYIYINNQRGEEYPQYNKKKENKLDSSQLA